MRVAIESPRDGINVRGHDTERSLSMLNQLTTPTFGDARLPPRFWVKVKVGSAPVHRPELGPCWEWAASKYANGYGQFKIGSRKDGTCRPVLAHRLAYQRLIGLIPHGLEPDHLCRRRACVKPAHLEMVSHRINLLRGRTITARNAAQTHCPQGHSYSGENLYIALDGRVCRKCHRDSARRRRARLSKQRRAEITVSPFRDGEGE